MLWEDGCVNHCVSSSASVPLLLPWSHFCCNEMPGTAITLKKWEGRQEIGAGQLGNPALGDRRRMPINVSHMNVDPSCIAWPIIGDVHKVWSKKMVAMGSKPCLFFMCDAHKNQVTLWLHHQDFHLDCLDHILRIFLTIRVSVWTSRPPSWISAYRVWAAGLIRCKAGWSKRHGGSLSSHHHKSSLKMTGSHLDFGNGRSLTI